ncbi:MAG: aldo/keto reductase [Alphaproteobacteria bacterium]|nr:aldo/keto reductase [Alphaproteobacteria bacterium]
MEYTTLGRTGLEVSVAGLGCGGSSRLGQNTGATEAQSVALVRHAMERGVNFFDTAEAYGTEAIVGLAVRDTPRDAAVISTKSRIRKDGELASGKAIVANLEASLRRLQTDYVDIFHLHGVPPADYDHVLNEIVPALLHEKEKGKFRHLGITETGPNDHRHLMLQRAFDDDIFDVVMFAFHMMNQNARRSVFPQSQANGIGTLLMFVVRRIFSDPAYLNEIMKRLADNGDIPHELANEDQPLGFLCHQGGASSVIDAAYRFARHEPGADVILFGTGSIEHLEHNIASILKPPLPRTDIETLYKLFGELEGVGLDLPTRR